jgi:hypothetical protein
LRATLCCTGVVPDPLNASETEPFEALLARVNVAEAAPEACGAKVAVNDALCPEAIVTGKEMPVIENSVPAQFRLKVHQLLKHNTNVPFKTKLLQKKVTSDTAAPADLHIFFYHVKRSTGGDQ